MATIDGFFKMMKEIGASDLHLAAKQQPMVRVHGEIERVDHHPYGDEELKRLLYEITPEKKIKHFEETGDVDFAYELPGVGRFRANFFNQLRGISAVFRLVPSKIMTMEELKLPTVIRKFCGLEKGLVLVTGPTGSGKSTTLAAMIDEINRSRKHHILTIEDPIEFVHQPKLCSINHREVGSHTLSFANALRASLREDPNIILVGEMRDLETINLALEAATTGHLVFGTLHTQSAAKTIDRIVDIFPSTQQAKVRITLSESLKGVIAQALFKRVGGGRIAALEILFCTPAVANLIREEKTHQITSYMQTQKNLGMTTLDNSILKLLQDKLITPELALEKAIDKATFARLIGQPGSDNDFF